MSDILNGMDIVDSLVLLMMLDATFCLADCACACTCEAGTDLDAFAVVEFTNTGYFLFLYHQFYANNLLFINLINFLNYF